MMSNCVIENCERDGLRNRKNMCYAHYQADYKKRSGKGLILLEKSARAPRNTRTYRIWKNMRTRVFNPNIPTAKYYSGKGIELDPQWDKYEHFLGDMGECPPGLSLDRIDSDLDYTPENCRWATPEEQNRNSQQCKLNVEDVREIRKIKGLTLKAVGEHYGVTSFVIWDVKSYRTWKGV